MPIINSVIKGAGGGGGTTLTCLNRSSNSQVDDKVLINPVDGILTGDIISDTDLTSDTYTFDKTRSSQAASSARMMFDTYFSATNSVYGTRNSYYEVSSTNRTVPWMTFDDNVGSFTIGKGDFPLRGINTTTYVRLPSNSVYNIRLYATSGNALQMTYYNTVTEEYATATVTNGVSFDYNYATSPGSIGGAWSYDGKYFFFFHGAATGDVNVFDIFKVEKDDNTGEITLTRVYYDDGTVISFSSSSYCKVFSSINDYTFCVSSASSYTSVWPTTLSSSPIYSIYQFDPATNTVSVKFAFGDTSFNYCYPVLLASSWILVRNSSRALYCYRWTGSTYTYDSDIGGIGTMNTRYPFFFGKQMGCDHLFCNMSATPYGTRCDGDTTAGTIPDYVYIDNPSNPTEIRLLSDSRLTIETFPFKDMIVKRGRIIFKDGDLLEESFPPFREGSDKKGYFIVDEYNGNCFYQQKSSTYENLLIPIGGDTYTSVGSFSYCLTPLHFMNQGATTVVFQPQPTYNLPFSKSYVNGTAAVAFFYLLTSGSLLDLMGSYTQGSALGNSGNYPSCILTDDLVLLHYKRSSSTSSVVMSHTSANSITTPVGIGDLSSVSYYLCIPSPSDPMKIYRFPNTGTATSVTVEVGTIAADYSSVSWSATTETWTLPIGMTSFKQLYINGMSLLQLKDNSSVFITKDNNNVIFYMVVDETNKTISIQSIPSVVYEKVGSESIKNLQVFYDHKFSVITERGNYLFSYTNGDLSTTTFDSFFQSSSYELYVAGLTYQPSTASYGPFYSVYRNYAYEACCSSDSAMWFYQMYKEGADGASYVAYNKTNIPKYNKESVTGKVKSLDNVNNTLTAEVVL